MTNEGKVKVALVVSAVVFLLFWNPITRSVILWILPLGSGVDDLVFIGAGILAGVFGIWKLRQRSEKHWT